MIVYFKIPGTRRYRGGLARAFFDAL